MPEIIEHCKGCKQRCWYDTPLESGWCHECAVARVVELERALVEIRDIDYRGNRHESSGIAYRVIGAREAKGGW